MNDKYTESDIHVKSPFIEKLDNFWFYYKIHVIVIAFVVLVLSVCIVQSCSRESEDVLVLYSGPSSFSPSAFELIEDELSSVLPADYDGDGVKNAGLVAYNVMSEEQIKEYERELETTLNRSYYTEQYQIYSKYVTSGECAVFLLDPWLYEAIVSQEVNILRPLSEVMTDIPENAIGEYGIKFSETALYKGSACLSQLPADTVLCLSRPMVMSSGSGNAKKYAQMTAMFVAMAQE